MKKVEFDMSVVIDEEKEDKDKEALERELFDKFMTTDMTVEEHEEAKKEAGLETAEETVKRMLEQNKEEDNMDIKELQKVLANFTPEKLEAVIAEVFQEKTKEEEKEVVEMKEEAFISFDQEVVIGKEETQQAVEQKLFEQFMTTDMTKEEYEQARREAGLPVIESKESKVEENKEVEVVENKEDEASVEHAEKEAETETKEKPGVNEKVSNEEEGNMEMKELQKVFAALTPEEFEAVIAKVAGKEERKEEENKVKAYPELAGKIHDEFVELLVERGMFDIDSFGAFLIGFSGRSEDHEAFFNKVNDVFKGDAKAALHYFRKMAGVNKNIKGAVKKAAYVTADMNRHAGDNVEKAIVALAKFINKYGFQKPADVIDRVFNRPEELKEVDYVEMYKHNRKEKQAAKEEAKQQKIKEQEKKTNTAKENEDEIFFRHAIDLYLKSKMKAEKEEPAKEENPQQEEGEKEKETMEEKALRIFKGLDKQTLVGFMKAFKSDKKAADNK